jgi:thiamine-monophosphate kinase
MALGEFELIRAYFERSAGPRRALLGIGDDCALIRPETGQSLAISTDMLVEGRHFFADVDPAALGHKALAVNLSDLAAMGARPLGFTLAMALPQVDEQWLAAFSGGLFALADTHDCELIGGDTTRGPLNLCITVFGEVPPDLALRRDGARAGDDLWVSGTLGAPAWAVACRLQPELFPMPGADDSGARSPDPNIATNPDIAFRSASDAPAPVASTEALARPSGAHAALARARLRLERPQPRVALGLALRSIASAAIDLSDGLVGDLGHVLGRSASARAAPLGALIDWPRVPVDTALDHLSDSQRIALALGGGDDYELLFCAPVSARPALAMLSRSLGLTLTRIGTVTGQPGVQLLDAHSDRIDFHAAAFDHFR